MGTPQAAYLEMNAAYPEFEEGPLRLASIVNGRILPHERSCRQINEKGVERDAFHVLQNRLDFTFSQNDRQVFRTLRPNGGLHLPERRLEYLPIQETQSVQPLVLRRA